MNSKKINLLNKLMCKLRDWPAVKIDLLIVAILYIFLGALRSVASPGLYMDGVNPDYLASQTLHPSLGNPNWAMPSVIGPVLGGLYYGAQNYYISMISFAIFGSGLFAVRLSHAFFGLLILFAVYAFTKKVSKSRLLPLFVSSALAVNVAFIASFRDQFYITISGDFWLILSMYFIYKVKINQNRNLLLGGVTIGLAVYSYFIFLFFIPCLLAYIAMLRNMRALLIWSAGLCLGMTPYLIGYISLFAALGGIDPGMHWLSNALKSLAPFSNHGSAWSGLKYAVTSSLLALNNHGNELMMFKSSIGGVIGNIISAGDILILLITLVSTAFRREFILSTMPIMFIAIASLFGQRLWVHHYIVLVPLIFALGALGFDRLKNFGSNLYSIGYIIFSSMFLASIFHGILFFHRLDRTGGVGMMSNASTAFAYNAMIGQHAIYCFPEWGFFMPFDVITGNKIPYVLDASPEVLRVITKRFSIVKIAFWKKQSEARYRQRLLAAGVKEVDLRTYRDLEGRPAFYVLVGHS